ncbi:hypothetical protein JL721_9246 [Aureococcus anophagefferens]|nr:hypothetical protein JL721_9246 [Aureococcus anophagefferens]
MGFRPVVDPEEAMDMSVPVGFLSSTWQHPDLGYRRPASTAARFAATNYERALELSRSAPGLTIGFSMADTDPDEHRRARHRVSRERRLREEREARDLVDAAKSARFLVCAAKTAPVITTSLRDVLRQRKSLLKGADVPVFRDAAQSWADYAAGGRGRVVRVHAPLVLLDAPHALGDDLRGPPVRRRVEPRRRRARLRRRRRGAGRAAARAGRRRRARRRRDDDDDDGAPRSARRSRAGVGKARERSMVGGYRTVKEMRDAGEKKSAVPSHIVDARQTMVHEAIEDHATVAQRRAVAERLYNKKKAREQRATTMLVKEKRHESAARELAALKDRQAAARAEHKKVKLRQQYVAARYKGAASVEAKAQMLRALSAHMAHQKKRKDARERSREPEIVEKVIKNRDGMGYRKQSVVAGAADGAALPGIAGVAPPGAAAPHAAGPAAVVAGAPAPTEPTEPPCSSTSDVSVTLPQACAESPPPTPPTPMPQIKRRQAMLMASTSQGSQEPTVAEEAADDASLNSSQSLDDAASIATGESLAG